MSTTHLRRERAQAVTLGTPLFEKLAVKRKAIMTLLLITFLLHPTAEALATCSDRFPENTPSRDFTLKDDGTALHTKTGLIWSRCSMGQTWKSGQCTGVASRHGFTGAFEQAKVANAAQYLGFNTWRLPAIEELQTIVEFHCVNPTINETVFPNTPSSWYWSASSYPEFPWYGQPIDFGNGTDDIFYKITYEAYPFPVRLVRSPKPFDPQSLGVDTDDDGINDALEITQGLNPNLKDNDISRDDRFVAQLYRDLYYREASSKELELQVPLLKKSANRVELIIALASAPEFQQQQLQLATVMALAINNDIATREWLNEWRNALQKGQSSTALIDVFMQKSALRDSYLTANNQNYSADLGARLLGRDLTTQEVQDGEDHQKTMTRAEFTQYWLNSLALKKIAFSQLLVIQIADLLAHYPLDSANLTAYSEQLDSGKLRSADLIQLVLNSSLYRQRFMPVAN
ncbi:MAG: DUF1566 domain-containing protein [Methylococcales bacterium]|nr:DUF1566 domain-containing protein [Methylococcales bacterium]